MSYFRKFNYLLAVAISLGIIVIIFLVRSTVGPPTQERAKNFNPVDPARDSERPSTIQPGTTVRTPRGEDINDFSTESYNVALDALEAIPLPVIIGCRMQISSRIAKMLRISDEESTKLLAIISESVSSIQDLERESKQLLESEELGDYYLVPIVPEGAAIRKKLEAGAAEILGRKRGDLFANALGNSDIFNSYLTQARIYFLEDEVDKSGRENIYLVTKAVNQDGSEAPQRRQLLNSDVADRFRSVFEEDDAHLIVNPIWFDICK